MARNARASDSERTEQEFQADVSAAIAGTEAEIFADATDSDEATEDADTSLEDMGDGLEGDQLDDTEEDADEDEELEASEEDEDEETGDDVDQEVVDNDEEERVQARREEREERSGQRDGRGEALRQERQQRRQAEQRASEAEDRYRTEVAELRGRLDELSRRPAQPQQQRPEERPDPEPDIFADPVAWRQWNERQTDKRIQDAVTKAVGGIRQEQAQDREGRINESFDRVARDPQTGFMFDAAFRALRGLNPQNSKDRATVQGIARAADPGEALLDWFERTGQADDFRENLASQIGLRPRNGGQRNNGREARQYDDRDDRGDRGDFQPRRNENSGRRAAGGQNGRQVRHEIRVPGSLNGTRGAHRAPAGQSSYDPEMLDDSDMSVFRFATR